ncbi:MAG: DUF1851 domain-containing protein [Streptomyces sp.]|nr:DUF1851 domain-containing protein [Streptomyces sp.]
MYERFIAAFPPDASREAQPYANPRLANLGGFPELISIGAGASFGDGIIRVHAEGEAQRARELARDMFPEFEDAIEPVAEDWMGRQIAARLRRNSGTAAELLLLEPGSGEAFEIDCNISTLFNDELIDDPDTYLSADLFAEWRRVDSNTLPPGQCVGFKVPLFLGGSGEVDNLEVVDVEVYWSLLAQLRAGTKDLPPGAKISEIRID